MDNRLSFRQELARHGLSNALFGEINQQLDARGMIIRHPSPRVRKAAPLPVIVASV